MQKCPRCGMEIDYLINICTEEIESDFTINSMGYGEYDEMDANPIPIDDGFFMCPECGKILFFDEQTATKFLKGEYLHFNSQSVSSFVKRVNIYTDLDSAKDVNSRKDVNFLHSIISPLYLFIKLYFLKLGFLDKTNGLIVKTLYAIYNFIYNFS